MGGPATDGAGEERAAAEPRAARVEAALKELILRGELPPGSDHLEAELGAMLGVSRTPVREAAVMLQAQGLVEIRPRRGLRVVPLTPHDMEEIYQILTELEPLAAQLVAERNRSAEAVGSLAECLEAMEAALARDDRAAWAEADDRFHRRLVSLCGNRRLAGIVGTTWDQVHRVRLMTLPLRPAPHGSNEDHRALLSAIEAGDGARARAVHREHRERSGAMLIRLLETHGLARF